MARPSTASVWAAYCAIKWHAHDPLMPRAEGVVCHNLTRLSLPAVKTRPSPWLEGSEATALTPSVWAWNVAWHCIRSAWSRKWQTLKQFVGFLEAPSVPSHHSRSWHCHRNYPILWFCLPGRPQSWPCVGKSRRTWFPAGDATRTPPRPWGIHEWASSESKPHCWLGTIYDDNMWTSNSSGSLAPVVMRGRLLVQRWDNCRNVLDREGCLLRGVILAR